MKLSKRQLELLLQDTHLSTDGRNLYAKCPKCGHHEFGISLNENHRFGCFRKSKCGFKGNIEVLLRFLGRDDILNEKQSISIFDPIELNFAKKKKIIDLPTIEPPFGWKRQYENDYLKSRGVTDYQFEKHRIGTSVFKRGYVTILIEMNEEVKGYVTRSYKTKSWHDKYGGKRYDNSSTDFSKMLMGYDEIVVGETKAIILVEGWLDKLSIDKDLELDSISWMKCCCTFGGKLSDDQIFLLKKKKVENLIILFESDIQEIIRGIGEMASIYFTVQIGQLPEGRDPNDMEVDEVMEVMENLVSYLDMKVKLV